MKRKTVRGLALFPVIAGVLIFVAGAAVGAGAMYWYGQQHKGGLGDSIEAGLTIDESSEDTTSETEIQTTTEEMTVPTTEPFTEPATEAFFAVTVTIHENMYYYNENPIEPDELMTIFRYTNEENLTVRIIKQNASRNASIRLKTLLENEGIPYVEESESADMTEPVTTTTRPISTTKSTTTQTTDRPIETFRPSTTRTTTSAYRSFE